MTGRPLGIALVPEWHGRALCAEADPEVFFPDKGGSTKPAKRLCASCPVRDPCRTEALERGERYGIWGGMSPQDRSKARRSIKAG